MYLKIKKTRGILKSQKAITLTTLIITVIIMIILAGVCISIIKGGDGLFEKATKSSGKYNQAAQYEADLEQDMVNKINGYISGKLTNSIADTTNPTVATVVASNVEKTTFTLTATGTDETSIQKYEFYIDGILADTVTTSETTAILDVTGKTAGTAYICKIKVYDGSNNALESNEITVNTLSANLTVGNLNTDKNQTFNGLTIGTYDNPLIPKGFKAVENAQDSTITTGAKWGTTDGYKYGLVIQDDAGNQFVWVPVDNINVTYERYEWQFESEIDSTYLETAPAIRNGGFYIARYEAGIAIGMSKPTSNTTAAYGNGIYKPVSKAEVDVWNFIEWGTNGDINDPGDGAVTVAKNMYPSSDNNYGVTSTLIYGTQWDATLKFIGAYNGDKSYATEESSDKGNYTGDLVKTGSSANYRQKNIYDMSGNVQEWTMEFLNDMWFGGYVLRGSSCRRWIPHTFVPHVRIPNVP